MSEELLKYTDVWVGNSDSLEGSLQIQQMTDERRRDECIAVPNVRALGCLDENGCFQIISC